MVLFHVPMIMNANDGEHHKGWWAPIVFFAPNLVALTGSYWIPFVVSLVGSWILLFAVNQFWTSRESNPKKRKAAQFSNTLVGIAFTVSSLIILAIRFKGPQYF